MESFNLNLNRLRVSIPKELPRLPTWPNFQPRGIYPDEEDEDGLAYGSQTEQPPKSRSAQPAMVLAEPRPISSGPKSNLDLINECDNFPYYHTDPKLFFAHVNTYYGLFVADYPETELGYVLPSVAEVFRGLPDWQMNDHERRLTLAMGRDVGERSRVVADTCKAMRTTGHFKILNGWRDELYPVYGPEKQVLFNVERAAAALFGIVTYGCHMTAYTRTKLTSESGDEKNEMKIWVPRRSATKQTYSGMLDNTVAGGVASGESAFESLVREAREEASLPEETLRRSAKATGTVTYFHIRDARAGGETRLLQPECQYVYDLELPEDVVPRPSDNEVEGFELMTVDEVKDALRRGEFKPNCALVLLDFFVRHGILSAEDEGYIEIVARLHRRLEFPTL